MVADAGTEPTTPSGIVERLRARRPVRLVVTGDVGSGKSSFASEAAEIARDHQLNVLEVGCVEFESDVAFLPLTLLLSQLGLCAGDHPSLDPVFGVETDTPNVLALGTAVADVLHEHSSEQPILVVVDDAHWADSDSLQALLFAARRLEVASVGFVLTAVPGSNRQIDRNTLDRLHLERWNQPRMVDHFRAHGFAPSAALAAAELVGGNPLAATLLIETVDAEQRSALTPLPPAVQATHSVAARVSDIFDALDSDVRHALAVLATLSGAEAQLTDKVLQRCGVSADTLERVEGLGIVDAFPTVRWISPIVRAAALGFIDRRRLLTIHRHVAAAALASGHDDVALRHQSVAGAGVDDDLAHRLEAMANKAITRGARLTAAEGFRQAAMASSDPADRSRRLAAAANEAFTAGNSEVAVPYARAATENGDGEQWATATSLLGEALLWTEGWAAADRTLCEGARRVSTEHPAHAAAMLIHATIQAVVALEAPAAAERYELARDAAERSGDELVQLPVPVVGATAGSLAGRARETDEVLAGAGDLALAALGYDHPIGSALAELVGFAAVTREDTATGIDLLRRANAAGQRSGSVGMSSITGYLLTDALWRTGAWTHALVEIRQSVDLARDSGFEFLAECGEGHLAWVLAATGRRDEVIELAQRSLQMTEPLQLRFLSQWAYAAIGLAALSDDDAVAAAEAYEHIATMWSHGGVHEPNLMWWQADHIEALVAAGRNPDAERALDQLMGDAELTGRQHARASVAKCQALLANGDDRLALLDEAVKLMRACSAPFDVARCLLLRGIERTERDDALAGSRDIAEARVIFDQLGARPWSDRASAARNEAASSPSGLSDVLTAAELRVALAIADGAQNQEAADQLFVSKKTVEYHLSNIYRKLGIRSRVELARRVTDRR